MHHRHPRARGELCAGKGLAVCCCRTHALRSRVPRLAGVKGPAPQTGLRNVRVTTANGCTPGSSQVAHIEEVLSMSRRIISPGYRGTSSTHAQLGRRFILYHAKASEKSVPVKLASAR